MFQPGTRLGPFEIRAPLGAGGMGEVYRARDTRLDRDVAIKVLGSSFSPDGLARFEQEARAAGNLNHPNLLALYDVGTHEGKPYLVSELLEGSTLRERLTERALPLPKVLDYAVQMTRGLAAAHEKGIVHRDLKPENVFVTRDGHVKILDFGLAKWNRPENLPSQLPTAVRLTEPGLVMGTVGYMSPEQVRGEPTDARSDLFALGTILYEMVSGSRAFERPTAAETMNAILHVDPREPTREEDDVPPALARLISRCLEKRPEDRFQSARDLAFAIDALSGPARSAPRRGGRTSLLAGALAILALAAAAVIVYLGRTTPSIPTLKLFVLPPESTSFAEFAISPDGKALAFTATDPSGKTSLWIRWLDNLAPRELPGTEEARFPFWSPDGRSLGYFATGKLKKIAVVGGPPQILADASEGRGGSWSAEGTILFAPSTRDPLFRVSAEGGEVTPVDSIDPQGEFSHRWPQFLPDGKRFLYLGASTEEAWMYLASLDSPEQKRVHRVSSGGTFAEGAEGRYLLFVNDGVLLCQPFDPDTAAPVKSEPLPLAQGLLDFQGAWSDFSVSRNGVLAYRLGYTVHTELVWRNRRGEELGRLNGPPGIYRNPEIAPDGRRVVVHRTDGHGGGADAWLWSATAESFSRFTFGGVVNPIWFGDGSYVAYSHLGKFYRKAATGAGTEELFYDAPPPIVLNDVSRDSRFLLYETRGNGNQDLRMLSLEGPREPLALRATSANEKNGQFSPDGRFIAYSSDESGREEVYVQGVSESGGRWQVSSSGGRQPRWRGDGRELYYLSGSSAMMAVPVEESPAAFRQGVPTTLFEVPMAAWDARNNYDVSPDGERFLVVSPNERAAAAPIIVDVGWTSELER
jgi:serine/threonine protein kinase